MTEAPELRGDRIVLAAHADGDVAAHVAGEDEETARRFGWRPKRSTEETVRAAYAGWARNWRDNGPVRAFAARDPDTATSIGVTRLEAHIATSTRASRRVAESAGFTQAGTFTDDDGTEMTRYARELP
jgi:RimJ/RimL family protein N-acetyltransferase